MNRLASTVLVTGLLALAACGSGSGGAESSGDGPWTYTDDRGETITADSTPARIVAQVSIAAGLWDLGIESVGVFGPLKTVDGSVDPQAGNVDPGKVTDVSTAAYGELDLEKLAELEPDLVVTNMFLPPELWYINAATEKKAEKLVPILAVDFKDASLIESIERVQKVAEALGADLGSVAAEQGRKDFDEASDRLRAVGKALAGKQILVVSATPDRVYLGDPARFPDLDYFTTLGLPLVKADAPDGSYWEDLSWENADKYDADIVLWDSRDNGATLEQLEQQPAFSAVRAARNGAYVPWQAVAPYSFAGYAKVMNELADLLEAQV